MLRTTEDLVEMRHWAEVRRARPCRDPSGGQLGLALPGQPCRFEPVGWDEFEVTFRMQRALFVYDDAPGGSRCFIGPAAEAHDFITAETAGGAYACRR